MFVIRLPPTSRTLLANLFCFIFLLLYTIVGGVVFLHLERENFLESMRVQADERLRCIQQHLDEVGYLAGHNSGENVTTAEPPSSPQHPINDPNAYWALAELVASDCLIDDQQDSVDPSSRRQEWNLRNSLLFGFGILTTLGYGRIEPATLGAQLFAVAWGCVGVPITVIILTNLGIYMRSAESYLHGGWKLSVRVANWCAERLWRERFHGEVGWRGAPCYTSIISTTASENDSPSLCDTTLHVRGGGKLRVRGPEERTIASTTLSGGTINSRYSGSGYDGRVGKSSKGEKEMSAKYYATLVLIFLAVGALFIPLLNGRVELINGLYHAYLCFTAIEYGGLIPRDNQLIPVVLVYMVAGLALSTIALDIGSTYVRRLYYIGHTVRRISGVRVWFGSKSLRVGELFTALGQSIGLSDESIGKLDVDKMIKDALAVKEGRLARVPQGYEFLEGIWPPELVPLFLREGSFPLYVDEHDEMHKCGGGQHGRHRRTSICFAAPEQLVTSSSVPSHLMLASYADGRLNRTLYSTRTLLNTGKKKREGKSAGTVVRFAAGVHE